MNVLDAVLASILGIVGIVIYYTIYNQFSANLGAAAALFVIVPIMVAAGVIIYVLVRSFSVK